MALVRWDCWVLLGPGRGRRDDGGTEGGGWAWLGMCSVGRVNVFSFGGNVSSFRANVFSFRPNVFTFAGHVFSFRRRAFALTAPSAGSGQALRGRRDDGGSGREAGVSAPWNVSTLSGQCVQFSA